MVLLISILEIKRELLYYWVLPVSALTSTNQMTSKYTKNFISTNKISNTFRLNPTVAFPWSEIQTINFRDKKFTIKSSDKKSSAFVFFVSDAKINKRILNLGVGNHSLYVRRRKPDTLEVLQMKTKSMEAKKQRLEQR